MLACLFGYNILTLLRPQTHSLEIPPLAICLHTKLTIPMPQKLHSAFATSSMELPSGQHLEVSNCEIEQ